MQELVDLPVSLSLAARVNFGFPVDRSRVPVMDWSRKDLLTGKRSQVAHHEGSFLPPQEKKNVISEKFIVLL